MTRLEQLQRLRDMLEKPNDKDAGLFVAVVHACYELSLSGDEALARKFGMTRSTATRWRNGTAAPHPAMRRPVFRFLAGLTRSALEKEQESAGRSSWTNEAAHSMAARGRSD